jgi:cell division septation protein DedD
MNQKIWRGLAIGAGLIVLLMVLYYLATGGPQKIGPSVATAPAPPGVTAPARPAPSAVPAPTPPAPPIESVGPPLGVPPGPEPKVTVLPPLEANQRYGILAGSYKKYRDAEKMLARLKKAEKPAFIQRDPRDIKRYQVWLGPFPSQSDAEDAAKSLRAVLKKPVKIEQIENPVPK